MYTYIRQFSHLNTAKIAGRQAPHKAILLLSIMDLIEADIITSPRIKLSVQLEEAFGRVWSKHVGSSLLFSAKVATPFWHMQSEPFYQLFLNNGQNVACKQARYSVTWLRENTYAIIDKKLFSLMQDKNAREEFRAALISTYLKDLNVPVGGNTFAYAIITLLGFIFHTAA